MGRDIPTYTISFLLVIVVIAICFIAIYLVTNQNTESNSKPTSNSIKVSYEITYDDTPKETERFELKDECSYILGNLIHSIKDESICQSRCISYCRTIDKGYSKVDFVGSSNTCHTCDCYCYVD